MKINRRLVSSAVLTMLNLLAVLSPAWSQTISFTKYSGNPVLDPGASGQLDDAHVHAPAVLKVDGEYKMWYSGHNGSVNRIFLATSPDGVAWTKYSTTPVLDLGQSGAWDDVEIGHASVIYDNGMYKMWYTGYHSGSLHEIGYATSPDGINWTRYAGNPVLTTGPDSFDDTSVQTPVVIKDGTIYKMWYTGYNPGSLYQIGYATSADGISWTKHTGPVIQQGSNGGWDDTTLESPTVIKVDNVYYAFYTGQASPGAARKIGYATSSDGIVWTKDSGNPVLVPGSSGAWDDLEASAPSVLYTNGEFEMWYSGHDGLNERTGYANSLDGNPLPQTVVLTLGSDFGAPGDTLRVSVAISNAQPVGGVQFDVLRDSQQAVFVGLTDTTNHPGFAATSNAFGDTARVIFTSDAGSVIDSGNGIELMTLLYRLTGSATLGSTIALALSGVEIGDSSGVAFEDSTINGQLQVGIRGDVNLDGRLSVLDVIKLVRILIGKESAPSPGSTAFKIADVNADNALNISDVIALINRILGLPSKPVAAGPSLPVMVRLDRPINAPDGRLVVPVILNSDVVISGLQATFTFDPALLEVGTPRLAGASGSLSIDSHITDGTLRLVMYSVQPGQGLAAGQSAMLYIPVTVRDGVEGEPSLTLIEIVLAGPQAQIVPVVLGQSVAPIQERVGALPKAFALHSARPNPFNPSTQIAYEVPVQAHITLIVFNLLGQEVARLVDEVKAPGRYEVTWDGRNARGLAVASGVYVYRMATNAGYSESRRMTLVK